METNRTEDIDETKEMPLPLSDARDLVDIACLINALLRNGGNLSRAAADLDIARRTFYDLLEKYNISCSAGELSIKLTPLLCYLEAQVPCLENYQ